MAEGKNDLVLAQNQYVYIQDATEGTVQVYVGPFKKGLTSNDFPVIYRDGKFVFVDLSQAISQNVTAPEGSYVVLENPAADNKYPGKGSNTPTTLSAGRKVNIPGPTSFAPWPGQVTTVLAGHQLRSNEYVIVRIYNAKEAIENWEAVKELTEGNSADAANGQLMIIKGTETSFFIPRDGFEAVKEAATGKYERKALTLERLEYCILLDENGSKRYEKGPQVVFPTATESFIQKKMESGAESTKFKAVELNDQTGLYIKVIADYEENGEKHKTGDEMFVTGKNQRIYYPRPEHALIEYGTDDGYNRRQRYYGIAIPLGEARYVLNKDTGVVFKKTGPTVFLPDPRHEIIVRRVLDEKMVDLWYPGNTEAKAYNEALRPLITAATAYVADTALRGAVDLRTRSLNRGTKGSAALGSSAMSYGAGAAAGAPTTNIPTSEALQRGTTFTPPPAVVLDTKYDGVPTINVWTGYAVQVVTKSGTRRLVKGPASILLDYDETLEIMELSTGTPKNTNNTMRTVYLRTDHNKVSDVVSVETKDMVVAEVKVSYRVNFEGEDSKWFAVENYVKFLTDHMRSLLRAAVKKHTIKDFIDGSAEIVRDVVLGAKVGDKGREGRAFTENGMRVYDVEVLQTSIADSTIAQLLTNSQKNTVTQTLNLASKETELATTRRRTEIDKEINELTTNQELSKLEQTEKINMRQAAIEVAEILHELDRKTKELEGTQAMEKTRDAIAGAELERRSALDAHLLDVNKQEAEVFIKKFGVITPQLTAALQMLAENHMMTDMAKAVAPLAVSEQQNFGNILERLFGASPLLKRLNGSLLPHEEEVKK